MTDILGARMAEIQQRQQARAQAADEELVRLKAMLSDHADGIKVTLAAEMDRIDDLKSGVGAQIRDATNASTRLRQDSEGMRRVLKANEVALRRQARWAWTAVGGACLAAVVIVLLAGWAATSLIDAARLEADAIRTANVDELTDAREEGQRAIAELHQQLAAQQAEVERSSEDVGAEFAALSTERDAVQAELERFSHFRDRLGITLVEGQNRVFIVVPEGQEIRAWRAAGLSNLARYNGRMYRVMAQR
ncbi:hypothetical protein E4191_10065 [Paracoccus liaowanqingii]|uniref:Uncharacterized protein n=2 Tax=Paracoccus liaowanqingii TaxID=2560053 RepID=A0A4P7HLG8_9RHOB|nr:hypothetical protein E4191_10065 [Paracoccus liaowanqingii]